MVTADAVRRFDPCTLRGRYRQGGKRLQKSRAGTASRGFDSFTFRSELAYTARLTPGTLTW